MTVKMFQHMIDDNNLPFTKYLDNSEGIEFIKMLISGRPNRLQAEKVCYHFITISVILLSIMQLRENNKTFLTEV